MERSWDISAGQLAHFILVALGDDMVNACVEIEGVNVHTLLMCSAELTQHSARACFMQLLFWVRCAGCGAGVERRDKSGKTALSLASQHGHLDAVRPLLCYSTVLKQTPLTTGADAHSIMPLKNTTVKWLNSC